MGAPTIVTIRPGVQFTPAAAASFRKAESEWGRDIDANSTYRDWNVQQRMYENWTAYANGRGPYPGHSRAIPPDQSMHCKGLALDSDDWTSAKFRALMERHGWIRTAAWDATEQHHFEYQSWRDQHKNDPVPEEDDMTPEQARKLDQIHERLHKELTGERIAGAVWSQGGIGGKLSRTADRVLAIYDAVRFGKKGVRTHGDLTAAVVSEIGAQQIARAQGGGDIDVQELAEAIAGQVTEVQASELADAILAKTAERLKG